MTPRFLFNTSAFVEILAGIAFLVAPAYVVGLLLGDGLGQTGADVSRMLGIGLFSLGIAAWETGRQEAHSAPRVGICSYNLGVAALLAILGTVGKSDGVLLWPTAGLHGLIGATMLWVIVARSRKDAAS
jgi:peptidoglycan/LPS O-acetylase OafA/YrhL